MEMELTDSNCSSNKIRRKITPCRDIDRKRKEKKKKRVPLSVSRRQIIRAKYPTLGEQFNFYKRKSAFHPATKSRAQKAGGGT